MVRKIFKAVGLCVLAVGFSSCRFFGTDYSTNSGEGNVPVVQSGPVSQLSLNGPGTIPLGLCTGPYRVLPIDKNGNAALPLDPGALFTITETSGATIFTDNVCTVSASSYQIPVLNDGSNSGVFYLSGKQPGNFFATATLNGASPSTISITYIPGPAKKIMFAGNQTIPSYTCQPVMINVVDATNTPTTYTADMVTKVDVSNATNVSLYDSGDCTNKVTDVQFPSGVKSKTIWVFASQTGTFNIDGTPDPISWGAVQYPITALDTAAPQLAINPPTVTLIAGQCYNFQVLTLTNTATPLTVRADTPVSLTPPSGVTLFPGKDCAGTANSALTISSGTVAGDFSARAPKVATAMTLTAASLNYISGMSQVAVGAAPAYSIILRNVPTLIRASTCSAASQVVLQDSFGNDAYATADTAINLTAADTQGPGTKYYTDPGCLTPAVTAVTIPRNQSLATFYFKSPAPGTTTVTAANATLGNYKQNVCVQDAQGIPSTLQVAAVPSAAPYLAGNCIPIDVKSVDVNGYPLDIFPNDLLLNISTGTARAFSDDKCANQITSTKMPYGTNDLVFYLWDTAAETVPVSLTQPVPTNPATGSTSVTITGNIPAQLVFSGITSPQGLLSCTSAQIAIQDRYTNASPVPPSMGELDALLSSTNGAIFYSDPYCTAGKEITQIAFLTNEQRKPIYFHGANPGALRLFGIGPVGVAAAVGDLTITPPPPLHLAVAGLLSAVTNIPVGQCVGFTVGLYDPSNVAAIYANTTVNLSEMGVNGNIFYSDGACGQALRPAALTLAVGQNPVKFWVASQNASPNVLLTASASNGQNASTSFSLSAGGPTQLYLSNNGPSAISAGTWSGPYDVTIEDQYGNPVPQSNAVTLTFAGSGISGTLIAGSADGKTSLVSIGPGNGKATFWVWSPTGGNLNLKIAGAGFTSNLRCIAVSNPRPTVTGIGPVTGPTAGGTPITIQGANFISGITVLIGGLPCQNLNVASSSTLTCASPPHAAATVSYSLTNPYSPSFTPTQTFTYTDPKQELASLAPCDGPVFGGTKIVIYGVNLAASDKVTIGGAACAPQKFVNSGEIDCTSPGHAGGKVSVVVTDANNATVGKLDYTYNAPILGDINPKSGDIAGGTGITLGGNYFVSQMMVKLDGELCTNLLVRADGTQATCNVPAHNPGWVPLTIEIPGLTSLVQNNAFNYTYTPPVPPSITSFDPKSGPTKGNTKITVTGKNFVAGISLYIGGVQCSHLTVVSPTSFTCLTGPHTQGYGNLLMRDASGTGIFYSLTYNYIGADPHPCECGLFAQMSNRCGDSHSYEWIAGFAPVPHNLKLKNNMPSNDVIARLRSPHQDPSGMTKDVCNRAPAQIRKTPMPSSYRYDGYDGYDLALFTNGNLGSLECPAFFSEYYSPLVVDLNSEGILLSAPNAGVHFDIEGNGKKSAISWPVNTSSSMFLVLPDATGGVYGINQLFGNNTVGPDGAKAANGFLALAKYDTNQDGVIDARDSIFSSLRLWSDANHDGIADAGELFTLEEMGIKSIDLKYQAVEERNDFYGNETLERSVVNKKDGSMRRIFDIWFVKGIN